MCFSSLFQNMYDRFGLFLASRHRRFASAVHGLEVIYEHCEHRVGARPNGDFETVKRKQPVPLVARAQVLVRAKRFSALKVASRKRMARRCQTCPSMTRRQAKNNRIASVSAMTSRSPKYA